MLSYTCFAAVFRAAFATSSLCITSAPSHLLGTTHTLPLHTQVGWFGQGGWQGGRCKPTMQRPSHARARTQAAERQSSGLPPLMCREPATGVEFPSVQAGLRLAGMG